MNWPLGNGETFRGVYDRETHELHTFERTEHGAKRAPVSVAGVHDERIRALVDEGTYREFLDGIELLEGAGAAFDRAAMLRGDVTPVFFGSAMTNFGVELFWIVSSRWDRPRNPLGLPIARRSSRPASTSQRSFSRFKPTWIRAIAIASRSRASARENSSAI